MSLSKRARRGISVFSKIQMNPARARYHLSPMRMISLDEAVNITPERQLAINAAVEAMEILVKNGEDANANLQVVREEEGHTEPPNEEGC